MKVSDKDFDPVKIPFDTKVELNFDQLSALKVERCGFSSLEALNDSYFQCEFKGDVCLLTRTRYQSKPLPLLNPKGNVTIKTTSFPELEDFQAKNPDVPIFGVDKLPELLGSGCIGQVYALEGQNESLIIKLEKAPSSTKMGQIFYPKGRTPKPTYSEIRFIDPISRNDMADSFNVSASQVKMLRKIPPHVNVNRFKGLVYVKEVNQWGLLFEKIDGKDLGHVYHQMRDVDQSSRFAFTIPVMQKLGEGLKCLADAGFPQSDLKNQNVMLDSFDSPVIVDYTSFDGPKTKEAHETSKQQYGTMIYRGLTNADDTFQAAPPKHHEITYPSLVAKNIPPEIAQVIMKCWEVPEETSWEEVMEALKASASPVGKPDSSPSQLPFDIVLVLSSEEMAKLYIRQDGKSDLEEYKDSIFEIKYLENGSYQLTRKADTVPFDKTLNLTADEIGKLWIRQDGKSDLEQYKDSIFETKYLGDDRYELTRRLAL